MALSTKRWASVPFTSNVGVRSSGEVAANIDQTVTHRMTATMGIQTDGAVNRVGMVATGARTAGASVITVADNTFDGPTYIIVGPYRLAARVDFEVGTTAANTATNIALAMTQIPELTMTVNVAAVDIEWLGQGRVEFRVENFGTVTSLTVTPTNGYLAEATPGLGAPEFTG